MDFLSEIIEQKKARLAGAKQKHPVMDLIAQAHDARQSSMPHALRGAIQVRGRVNVIAEIKRASPSRGVIRARVEPASLARSYEAGGAAAISVLTEEDRFQGSLADLCEVRAAVSIPVLRKDFIFDEIQLYETAATGADALLLIVAALDDQSLSRLRGITEDDLGIDALVEVHTAEEMRRATASGATLIGVNNRDLHTFRVSLDVSAQLAHDVPQGVSLISESGMRTGTDIRNLLDLGYSGFLIGETLMRADQPGEALRALLDEAGKEGKIVDNK